MIKVKYNRVYNRITVQGHAGSAPIGEDLVCSAASILVHTLDANVENMEVAGIATKRYSEIKEGFTKISCTPVRGFENVVKATFQSVCVGFEILADKFPEYISYKIMG